MNRRSFFKSGLAGIGAAALTKDAWALKYYPLPSDKKWAVLYGTWCGTSRDAAVWISEGLGGIADVFDVREQPDLSRFDYLVIGGSIRGGKMPKELQDFVSQRKGRPEVQSPGIVRRLRQYAESGRPRTHQTVHRRPSGGLLRRGKSRVQGLSWPHHQIVDGTARRRADEEHGRLRQSQTRGLPRLRPGDSGLYELTPASRFCFFQNAR